MHVCGVESLTGVYLSQADRGTKIMENGVHVVP
jgi:hypothetical protein